MLNLILYGIAISAQLILCFLVYYATSTNPKGVQKRLAPMFYLLSASTIMWSLTQSAYDWLNDIPYQGFVLRLGTITTTLMSVSFLAFTFTLVNKRRTQSDLLYIPLVLATVIPAMFLNFFTITLDSNAKIIYEYNFLIYGYITLIPILIIVRTSVLLIGSRKRTRAEALRKQYTAVLHGMLLSGTISFTGNFALIYLFGESKLSSVIVAVTPVVFTASIAYAVFSLKLFNFRKFFSSILIYGAAFVIAYSSAFFAIGIVTRYFNLSQSAVIALLLPVSLFLFLLSSWIARKIVIKLTRSNREGYSLNQISTVMRTISSTRLLEDTTKIIRKTLGLDKCAFIFITSDGRKLWKESGPVSPQAVTVELIDNILRSVTGDYVKLSEKHGVLNDQFDSVIPIDRDGVRGALLLGEKLSGRPIYSDEQKELKKAAFEVSLGIENTIQYEKIKQFNLELEAKIEDATSKLRRTNDKLKALDEAKDEFISMASHQLRTPLTSIKGYISMILDGDMGKVPSKQRKMLSEAFSSSQRMVYLISDLLNVSRLKNGKFIIEAVDVYLPDVIEEEIDLVKEMAEAKGIKIHYHKPKRFNHIELDDIKIRQVIMNFIDNAIHYTPEGGEISIVLEENSKSVSFKVIDSGIGVPRSEQYNLFTKFYRAGNARKTRPDGTGLGLFMGKKVIVASGGSIVFNSTEGKGSTFGFNFPKKSTIGHIENTTSLY